MKVNTLKNPQINQNGYHKNTLTKERIGALFIYPIEYTPNDCLPCDGYSLLISDYEELFKIIGTKFNQSNDSLETFRIPDYNITKNFLQPGKDAGLQIDASLPQHTHNATVSSNGNHTHNRGSMNITGSIGTGAGNGIWNNTSDYTGALILDTSKNKTEQLSNGSNYGFSKISFDASKGWTGETSENGEHTHSVYIEFASNPLYKNSTTVQPPSQLVHICIKYK